MIEKKHLPWLDLLRFIAAFEVLAVHARGFIFVEYNALLDSSKNALVFTFYALTRMGFEAVIVFFVLSGFLVGGKAIERLSKGTFRNKDYIIDRMVRIMVPLIPALLPTLICSILVSESINFLEFFGNLFSLQGIIVKPFSGNAPLWSLSYEFWFYLLIFTIAGMIASKVKKWYWFIGLVLILSIFTILNPAFLFCWAIGAIVYLYKSNQKSNMIFGVSMIGLILLLASIQISVASKSINPWIIQYLPSLNILYIMLSAVFAICIQQVILRFPQRRFFIRINNAGSFLASFSYTLYLTHYPLLNFYKSLGFEKYNYVGLAGILLYLLSIIGCIIIAYLIYLPFENKTDYYKSIVKRYLINA